MACFRLFTLPPFPPRPLFAVPRLYRRISLSTSRLALGEYLRFLFFATELLQINERSPIALTAFPTKKLRNV
jgi:hypothetical protein